MLNNHFFNRNIIINSLIDIVITTRMKLLLISIAMITSIASPNILRYSVFDNKNLI